MTHIDWTDPDHIILSNNVTSDHRELTSDVRKHGVKQIRLMRIKKHILSDGSIFKDYVLRYVVNSEVKWGSTTKHSEATKRGDCYFLSYYKIINDEQIGILTDLYKQYNREEILNDLGI